MRIILISIFFFTSSSCLFSQWAILRDDADSLIIAGSNFVYNIQFDSASVCFKEVIKRYPDHPAGYFLSAMIEWWQIAMFRESKLIDEIFLNKIEKTLEVCDKRLEYNEFDITALFFKGGALGYRGRYYAIRENWLKAALDGKGGFDILIKCWKIAPGNADIELGTGIFNYFADALPEKYPIIKVVAAFLPPGDKELGIMQLKSTSKYARYAPTEAKVVLLQIFYSFEENYREALIIAEELFSKYPNNPYFHRYLGRCYVSLGYMDKWEATWREVVKRCIRMKRGYDRLTAREALYYVGVALFHKGEFENSLKYLYKADEACRYVDKDPSGFMVKTNLYIGKIYDMQGKRNLAIKQYKKILDWDDYQKSHNEAEIYTQKPYGK